MEEINKAIESEFEIFERFNEDGMTTAELLGNAALAVAALVAIWVVLQQIGLDVMEYIRSSIGV
jgi:hypothetical protein